MQPVDSYFTRQNLELIGAGVATAGVVAGGVRLVRATLGPVTCALAIVGAELLAHGTLRLGPLHGARLGQVAAAMAVAALGGWLAGQQLPAQRRGVLCAALVTALAVWTAIPETGEVVVIGSATAGLTAVVLLFRARPTPAALAVLAAAVIWPVARGLSMTDLRAAGALAGAGLFLWWPVGQGARAAVERLVAVPGVRPGSWLLLPHLVLAFAAARWIGVAPEATVARLVLLGILGTAVAACCRCSEPSRP